MFEQFGQLGVDRVIVSLFADELDACLSKLESARASYEHVFI
jgi:hypothetical protein